MNNWIDIKSRNCKIKRDSEKLIISCSDGTVEGFVKANNVIREGSGRIKIGTIVIAGLLLTYFTTDITIVCGNSMQPTYSSGQVIIKSKVPNDVSKLLDKKVIVKFISPDGDTAIKRIVATGGDTVEYKNSQVFINGEYYGEANAHFVKQQRIAVDTKHKLKTHETIILKPNEYFVIGDNKDNSIDSRDYGPITDYAVLSVLGK
jgi:signal peptidase I